MRLSTLNLPALVLLVTSVAGDLSATVHMDRDAALKDVRDELQTDYDAPDDLDATDAALSDWIGNLDFAYSYHIETLSVPGFRVVAYDHTAGAVVDQRLVDTADLADAQQFAGMIWNQRGFGHDDVSVYLYRFGADEPVFTIQNDDEGERTAFESERGGYWYVDEVQGGERYTIAKNLTEDQARAIAAGAQPFDGVTGDRS